RRRRHRPRERPRVRVAVSLFAFFGVFFGGRLGFLVDVGFGLGLYCFALALAFAVCRGRLRPGGLPRFAFAFAFAPLGRDAVGFVLVVRVVRSLLALSRCPRRRRLALLGLLALGARLGRSRHGFGYYHGLERESAQAPRSRAARSRQRTRGP